MIIKAHTQFRLVGVCFHLGSHDFHPTIKNYPLISGRNYLTVKAGEIVEKIWTYDGFSIDQVEGKFDPHPLMKESREGNFEIDFESLERDYTLPVDIPGLMTIME